MAALRFMLRLGWRTLVWGFRCVVVLLFIISAMLGFGVTPGDSQRVARFTDAVLRWQVDSDFKRVGDEYVRLSVDAMQARVVGVSTTDFVMAVRSIPGLPAEYAANEGSRNHYEKFTAGALTAYLRLCAEQDIPAYLDGVEYMGKKANLKDQDVRDWLHSFSMSRPVVQNDPAVAAVRKMLVETQAGTGFTVRVKTDELLLPHVKAIAKEHGWPEDPAKMTAAQQEQVYSMLDAEIQKRDYQLWRTKQLTDILNGIWGQVFGQIYREFIDLVWLIRRICRYVAIGLAVLMGGWGYWRYRRRMAAAQAALQSPEPPAITA